MNSLERVLKTLRFEEPDRVPFFEQGVASNVASEVIGREAFTGGGAFRRLGVEAAIAGQDACAEYQERYFADWCTLIEMLDFDVATLPWAGGGIPSAKLDEYTYLYGNRDGAYAVLRFDPASDTMHTVDSSLRGAGGLHEVETEIRAMAEGHAGRPKPVPEWFGLLSRFIERYRGQRAIGAGPCLSIPMEPAWLEAMLVLPDMVERYLWMQADRACDEIECLASMGVHILWGGGDFCANKGPVYSPAQFRQFMLGPLRQIVDCCHRLGIPYIFRTDGVTWPVADLLFVEAGADGYGEIDKQAGMDLSEIRTRYPRLILWGNVDCGHTLSEGTREQVVTETRACIEAAAPGGGYWLGSSNVIHAGVPAANFLAMAEACRTYGRY